MLERMAQHEYPQFGGEVVSVRGGSDLRHQAAYEGYPDLNVDGIEPEPVPA